MPLPPPDPIAVQPHTSLQSPREAAAWAIVYRRRIRERPRERWLRVVAMAGTLLVHLLVLFVSILGSAYQPLDLPDNDKTPLLVHLVDKPLPPPPPPPPPVRGTPPKQLGPRHQGSASALGQVSNRASSSMPSPLAPVAVSAPAIEPPVITAAASPSAPKPETVAAPLPPVSLPAPAPTPALQPIPVSSEPPPITVNAPAAVQPVAPKFQPEPVRKPQLEGHQPMPPPASLAPVELPPQSSAAIAPPTIAIVSKTPQAKAVPSPLPVSHVDVSAAPPVPELQPVPLPAQASPTVNLAQQLSAVTPNVSREQPRIQSPSIHVAEQPQPEPVPMAAVASPSLERSSAPAVQSPAPALPSQLPKVAFSVARPQLSTPAQTAAAQQPTASPPATTSKQQAASASQAEQTGQRPAADQRAGTDVSTAPDATPQGSDSATQGQPSGVPGAPQIYGKDGSIHLGESAQGQGVPGQAGQGQSGSSEQGTPAPGNATGPNGTYIQVRPHGDTDILSHGTPKIGYKHTRFEDDWTPLGESSVDTALRHAVEKTTVSHTFHLPRGVRVKCVVMPLLPASLFGCGNGDPPPAPVDDKVYDRMHLAPANPSIPVMPAAAASAPAPLKLSNSTQCASARISGGPLPPGCEAADASAPVLRRPASTSSSWVPASDQFH